MLLFGVMLWAIRLRHEAVWLSKVTLASRRNELADFGRYCFHACLSSHSPPGQNTFSP
jgi:hypothetical protein